ncbi:MAG: fructokinase [Chloroflexota bacterium]|nr:ROK family protein [Chloroflexota bacterium]GIK65308.1 MAG: fructokinase [Chloroflexota bacterium]
MFGGIEAGGTEFVCAVGTDPQNIVVSNPMSTTTPAETFQKVITFFRQHPPVKKIGIGSFGPVDIHRNSPTFGYITTTPKPGWANTDFGGFISRELGLPVEFDTDVNTAALGEHKWGAAVGLDDFLYLTIGTGVGGGVMVNGRLVHGLIHPELGHILLPRDPINDPFEGNCPFHKDCLEGLTTGPALQKRWKVSPKTLPVDHPAWELEAEYIAIALVNFACTLSPKRIILGGGVMRQTQLFPMIRSKFQTLLNGYLQHPAILQDVDHYIVPPALGDHAGVLGAIALAQQ